jgi:internalin A
MPNDDDLTQLKDLLFSEDESNFELAMQIIKGLNVDRWTIYSDLRRCAEFFNTVWQTSRDIPVFLRELRRRQLNLSRRNINYLPDYLAVLAPAVKTVSLQDNQFTHIPTPVLAYNQLQRLDMTDNKIGEIANDFWLLPNVEELNLAYNLFDSISPNIASAKSLHFLDMRGKHYVKAPPQIAHLPNLRTLYWGAIDDNAKISPADLAAQIEYISRCQQLTELKIYSSDFYTFPKSLCLLRNLQKLTLYFCTFPDIPDSLAELKNLESLTLHYRTNSKIPFAISQLPKLRELTITSAYLKTLPEFIAQMPQLEILTLPYSCYFAQNTALLRQNLPNTKITFTQTTL